MSTADDDDDKTLSGPPAAAPRRAGTDDDVETGIHAERRRGRAAAEAQPGHTLPLGTRLRDYEITGLIGEGGFGIVYVAWDHSLQRRVAIKEYMPASMAARVSGSSAIVVKSERHLDTFRAGLKSFVNEARLLARFDHPSLVKVYRFWEENGTAYMVMPYYEGPTLKGRARRTRPRAERGGAARLAEAASSTRSPSCTRRSAITATSRPTTSCSRRAARCCSTSARRAASIGDMTHAITVVLKPGYAPIEQYGDVATMAQGAWTDLYALGCVVYYAIAGKTPTSSVERLMDDRPEPLAVSARGPLQRRVPCARSTPRWPCVPADRPQTRAPVRALLDAGLAGAARGRRPDSATIPFAALPGAAPPAPNAPSTWGESAWRESSWARRASREPSPHEPASTQPPTADPAVDGTGRAGPRSSRRPTLAPQPTLQSTASSHRPPRAARHRCVHPAARAQRGGDAARRSGRRCDRRDRRVVRLGCNSAARRPTTPAPRRRRRRPRPPRRRPRRRCLRPPSRHPAPASQPRPPPPSRRPHSTRVQCHAPPPTRRRSRRPLRGPRPRSSNDRRTTLARGRAEGRSRGRAQKRSRHRSRSRAAPGDSVERAAIEARASQGRDRARRRRR
jgi:serine/threonine protein kinase